ncbi:MAG: adenine deaminase [Thermoanaerobacteraceae bacterium]|nr:adenine deaminase [Thermoanaerobacteraceae bacterium]
MLDANLIDVALGHKPADLIIKNGKLVNVHTREVYQADVAIGGNKIAVIGDVSHCRGPETTVIDAQGEYLLPGFIDAHIHFESSMLSFSEFAKMVLRHGTTVVASDLMEITIVSGVEGAREILEEARKTPVTLLYPVPSFMSESDLQTIGSNLGPELVKELLTLPEAVGLAEVLVPPVLAKSPLIADMLAWASQEKKTAEGHAPALGGKELNAYCTAGIRSDHESTTAAEALAKLRCGLRVLMREGSASTDLLECLKVITENGIDPRHCAMISDDIDALHLATFGHMDHKIRMAVKAGVDPVVAIQMATINPAESLKIDDLHGSIAPGKFADIVLVNDLTSIDIQVVIAKGRIAVRGSEVVLDMASPSYSERLLNTVRLASKIYPENLAVKVSPEARRARVRVIGASSTSLLTEALEATLPVVNGEIQPDVNRDILPIAVVERYGKNGNIGRGFISGFGIKKGAIATSVGHDHHNITVLGTNYDDMALAVNRVAELTGGLVLAVDGKVIRELPLPICGLLSMEPGEAVAAKVDELQKELQKLGCPMPSPFMTLSFITLIFIPAYGITDKGLVNVYDMALVDPVLATE